MARWFASSCPLLEQSRCSVSQRVRGTLVLFGQESNESEAVGWLQKRLRCWDLLDLRGDGLNQVCRGGILVNGQGGLFLMLTCFVEMVPPRFLW